MIKRIILIILLLGVNLVSAEPLLNEKYSFKDFTNTVMTDYAPEEFNDSIIVGSNFYQEGVPNRQIFPAGMKGVIFRRCNLDNVYIDKTKNTIEKDCTHKNILVQNDWSDWILDKDLKPIEPLDKEERLKLGISIDAKDISATKMSEYIVDKKRGELAEINE